jgi:hypothetical protein
VEGSLRINIAQYQHAGDASSRDRLNCVSYSCAVSHHHDTKYEITAIKALLKNKVFMKQ